MDSSSSKLRQFRNIVRIATAAERTKRAGQIMQYIADNGGLVQMQDLYDHFDSISNRTVRQNVADINDDVVVKYRTTNNIVEVKLKDVKTTEYILSARRIEELDN